MSNHEINLDVLQDNATSFYHKGLRSPSHRTNASGKLKGEKVWVCLC